LSNGIPQRWIAEAAYDLERDYLTGKRTRVGVNKYAESDGDEITPPLFEFHESGTERQQECLKRRLIARDETKVSSALTRPHEPLADETNRMPYIMDAGRGGAT